ncbi:hypothetical protein EV179_002737 [Coemansia sp. RSA 487]|nr:hypothetical protein EV179_002737 [Coemansia sp. RSA 487]
MSKRNLEEQQTARLGHLHTASRMAFRICPQLAAFYGNEFCTALGSQKVANTIVRYQCPYCGSPLVDGRSVSRVSVVRSQRGASNSCGKKNKKIQPKKRSRKKSKTGNDCKRRVIKIWLSDTANAHQPKMTKEELADAQKNMKNTVEYICQLCDSRIVFPGTTVSGLDAAGLAGDLTTTETSSRINDGVAPAMTKEPIPPASPRISPGSIRIEAEATTNGVAADAMARESKEIDSLPQPPIMGENDQQRSSWNINQKLVELLQYLNPLLYARLVQSLIQFMMESFGSSNVASYNTRITNDGSQGGNPSLATAVPADAIAIDCGYMNDSNRKQVEGTSVNRCAGGKQFITVSPEFEYLPDLELGPSSGINAGTNPAKNKQPKEAESSTVVQMSPIPELTPGAQMRGAMDPDATPCDPLTKDKMSAIPEPQATPDSNVLAKIQSADEDGAKIDDAVADMQSNTELPSDHVVAELKDETKDTKKGKRKKNKKIKGKSK